ncbi:hypothetical protein [Brucella pseudogrignonensis]|uniref:hypothetical protein n=1 Tax=Brucella pseudogrignonensis TaxID=419475 RepID=UPI0038D19543
MAREDLIKAEAEKLLQGAKDREAVTEALAFLFPKLKKTLNLPDNQFSSADGDFAKHRISNSLFARSYFDLNPDPNFWGRSEIGAMEDPKVAFEKFSLRLARVSPRDRLKIRGLFLDVLSSIISETTRRQEWFMAVSENARLILNVGPEANLGMFGNDVDLQITFLLADILKPLDRNERGAIISYAIDNSLDISFLCNMFRYFIGDVGLEGAKGLSTDAFGAESEILRQRLVYKVEAIVNSSRLYDQCRPQDILWFWWGSGQGEAVRRFTSHGLDDPRKLRTLLEVPISTVISSAGNYEQVNRRSWSAIMDLEELHAKAMQVAKEVESVNADAARRFLAAYDRDD